MVIESVADGYLVKLRILFGKIGIGFFGLLEKVALFENLRLNHVCLFESDSIVQLLVELAFALHYLVHVVLDLALSIQEKHLLLRLKRELLLLQLFQRRHFLLILLGFLFLSTM